MKQIIPFFSLSRQWNNLKKTIEPKILKLLESNQFVGGPYISDLEKKFSEYIGSTHTIGCNSGTDALWLALKALKVEPNSIVLTTPFSFIASSSEIAAHRANPVFIDIDETYNISPSKIETWLKLHAIKNDKQVIHKKTGRKVSGIITVDLFGQCANYDAIKKIADEWNLWIIEDACQAVGAHIASKLFTNKKAGTLGDIACFSLYPTKNLGVCGDGGLLTTNNPELAQKLYKLRNHGRKSNYEYECYGINSRLDAIQALVATEKLEILDQLNNQRREIAQKYTERLKKLDSIKTPDETIGHHVYHQYCIQTENRDALKKHLTDQNIGTNIFYPKSLDKIPYLTPLKELQTECPVAHKATQTILALPVWPELTDQEIDCVCGCIEAFATKPVAEKLS
ncbi:DegT/DnrJ/EryC1/StrS family aminotransferase [Candidatus Babeliales bacterium]|nr:DegT/DnrJ/EryC1/StrS family aminotransferase [Candidatus Babeliales bacterium]